MIIPCKIELVCPKELSTLNCECKTRKSILILKARKVKYGNFPFSTGFCILQMECANSANDTYHFEKIEISTVADAILVREKHMKNYSKFWTTLNFCKTVQICLVLRVKRS